MAAFTLQNCQIPFLDTAYITAATINATPALDLTTTTMAAVSSPSSPPPFFHPYYSPLQPQQQCEPINTTVDSCSSLEKSRTKTAAAELKEKEKKRRKKFNRKPTGSNVLKRRRRSRKKCGGGHDDDDDDDDDSKENEEEKAPTDYIHVRARRGQATDSHSLAERVRREKISERMKHLQGLVPGCDKVIGKAIILDEIINYVQSLQNQVEFLSVRLASVTPSELLESNLDMNEYLASQPRNQIEPTFFMDGVFPPVDSSSSFPFPMHGQESYGDRQRFLHPHQQFQFQFNDFSTFQ